MEDGIARSDETLERSTLGRDMSSSAFAPNERG